MGEWMGVGEWISGWVNGYVDGCGEWSCKELGMLKRLSMNAQE